MTGETPEVRSDKRKKDRSLRSLRFPSINELSENLKKWGAAGYTV